jgi:zinc/manganese transport system substrate-binding protein
MTFKSTKRSYLVASVALGLGITSSAFANDKLPVVASFSVLGDLVSEVGGDHIDLTTLVKVDGDAHVYSPTPKDALAVRKAKLLVINGLNFEGWMPRFLESAKFEGTTVVASNGIDVIKTDSAHLEAEHSDHEDHEEHVDHHDDHEEHADHHDDHEEHADDDHEEHADHDDDHEEHADHHEEHEEHADHHDDHEDHADEVHESHADEHDHGGIDPHSWSSFSNVKIYIKNIEIGLSKVDPENAHDYQQNAQVFLQKLNKLEVKLHAQLETIPVEDRVAITPHNAFRYMGRDFNIKFMSPQGTSTESEASASDLAAIIRQVKENHVNAVFIENIADNRMIEQISNETNATIGGKLFSGSLSDKNGPAPTYLQMMEYNITTIVSALTK